MVSLRTAAGDGGLRVELDGFGAFGSDIGSDATNAFYDPTGDIEESGTTYESGIAIRVGSQGSRTFLTSGSIGSQQFSFWKCSTNRYTKKYKNRRFLCGFARKEIKMS